MKIIRADKPEHFELIRELFREYEASIGIDLCFQHFENELADLPGQYAEPRGTLLLAKEKNYTSGCVAMREINAHACELKRLYVRKPYRGRGIGRMLAREIINRSLQAGYTEMYLDTLAGMTSAMALYKSLGFRTTNPYYFNPLEEAVFFKLDLTA